MHRPRGQIRSPQSRTAHLGREGASLFALSNLAIVLDEGAADAACRPDIVRTDVPLDLIRFPRPGVLDRREKALASAEEGHGGARPIARFIAKEVRGILAPRLPDQAVLRPAVENARTPESQATRANVRELAEAGAPGAALDLLFGMRDLAGEMVRVGLIQHRGLASDHRGKRAPCGGRRTRRLQRICIWHNRPRMDGRRAWMMMMLFDRKRTGGMWRRLVWRLW